GDELDETARLAERARAAVRRIRKAAGAIVDAFLLQLLLGLADPRDLGPRVDDPRDRVEIDVRLLAGDALGDRDALLFRLVREHRPAHDVADRIDVRQVRAAFVVDFDEAARVALQADRIGV